MKYRNFLIKQYGEVMVKKFLHHNLKFTNIEEMLIAIETPLIADNTFQIIKPYMKWIILRFASGQIYLYEDILSRTIPMLLKYDSLKKKRILCNHDINQINSLDELSDLVECYDNPKTKAQIKWEEEHKFYKDQADLILNNDDYKIVIPKTVLASQYFGKNTRWCTAAEKHNAFESYYKSGPLYIILHKSSNQRWQFHFATKQYMDEKDNTIDFYDFKQQHPTIVDFFIKMDDLPDKYFIMFASISKEDMNKMLNDIVVEFKKKYNEKGGL